MPNLLIQPAPVPSWGRAVERAERIRGSQNQNLLAEQRLKDYPKEEQWRAEQRGRQRTTWNREDEAYKRGVERLKFKNEADALDYMIKSSPMINWQNYPDSRQHLLDMGLNPSVLPKPEVIYNQAMKAGADPNQFFEAWKDNALMTGQQRLELIKQKKKPSPYGPEALAFEETKAGIKERTGGYKPKDEAAAIRLKEAGRPQTTINVGEEKFGLQKEISMAERRKNILTAKDDKDAFDADAPVFNKNNKNNEVAYWDAEPGRFHDDKAVILRLPAPAIKAGWTPDKLQETANAKGITIKQVLKDIGVIK